jgi:hypothetical protein
MADLKEGEIDELLADLDALDKRDSIHFPPPAPPIHEAEAEAPSPVAVTPPLRPRKSTHSRSATLASLTLDGKSEGKADNLPVVDREPETPTGPSPKTAMDTTPTKPKPATTVSVPATPVAAASPTFSSAQSSPVVPSPASQRTVNASPSTNTLFSDYSGHRGSSYSAASTARTTPPASPEVETAGREKGDSREPEDRISESSERDAEALEELVAAYDDSTPEATPVEPRHSEIQVPAPAPAPTTEQVPPSPPSKSPSAPNFSPARSSSLRYRAPRPPSSQGSLRDEIPPVPAVPDSPSQGRQPDSAPPAVDNKEEEKKAHAREMAEHDEKTKAGGCQCVIS